VNNVFDIINIVAKLGLTIIGLLKVFNGELVEGLLFLSYAKLMDIEEAIRKQKQATSEQKPD